VGIAPARILKVIGVNIEEMNRHNASTVDKERIVCEYFRPIKKTLIELEISQRSFC